MISDWNLDRPPQELPHHQRRRPDGRRHSIRAFYKRLVQLRKEMTLISEGRIEFLLRDDPHVLCYRRFTGEQELLVLCNLTGSEQTVTIGDGWNKILLSNRERTTFVGRLLPYDCVVLTR